MSGSNFEISGRKSHSSVKRRHCQPIAFADRGTVAPYAKKSKRIFEQKFCKIDSHPILNLEKQIAP